MIANGYQNATDRNTNYGKVTTADKVPTLVIESGEFAGGMNTVKNDDYAVMTINGGTFRNVSQAAVLNWNELTITDGVFEVGRSGAGGDHHIVRGGRLRQRHDDDHREHADHCGGRQGSV